MDSINEIEKKIDELKKTLQTIEAQKTEIQEIPTFKPIEHHPSQLSFYNELEKNLSKKKYVIVTKQGSNFKIFKKNLALEGLIFGLISGIILGFMLFYLLNLYHLLP